MSNYPKIVSRISVLIIILISIKFISTAFSLNFNSETALHVLMIDNFRFLEDNFIWGETYLGSLFPLIGSIIQILTGAKSLYIATILQYVFLFLLYFYVCKIYVQDEFLKPFLALVIFIPPLNFIQNVYIGYSYLSSLPVFIAGMWCLFEYLKSDKIYYLTACFFLFFLAGWVMKFFIYYTSLTSVLLIIYTLYVKRQTYSLKVKTKIVAHIIIYNIFIYWLLNLLLVTNHTKWVQEGINKLNTLKEAYEVFIFYFTNFYKSITFNGDGFSIIFSYAFLFLTLNTFIIGFIRSNHFRKTIDLKLFYLILLLLFYIGGILFSNWNYFNGVQVKYLSPAFLFFSIIIFSIYSRINNFNLNLLHKRISYVLLFLFVFSGAATEISFITNSEKRSCSAHNINQQLTELKINNKFFYGGYYHAHKLSGATSNTATATVSSLEGQFGFFRNNEMRNKVLESSEIYVIPNGLFKNNILPDTLHDYGVDFVKSKERPYMIQSWDNSDLKKDGFTSDFWILQKYKNISISPFTYKKSFVANDMMSWVGKKDSINGISCYSLDLTTIQKKESIGFVFSKLDYGKYDCQVEMFLPDSTNLEKLEFEIFDEFTKNKIVSKPLIERSYQNGYSIFKIVVDVNFSSNEYVISVNADQAPDVKKIYLKRIQLVRI